MRSSKRVLTGLSALMVLCSAGGAWAQSTSAALEGTVLNRDGDPVADVVVEARSQTTGAVRTEITGADGRYRMEALNPGTWMVLVRLSDGSVGESHTVHLALQQRLRVDFIVSAAVSEKVTVSADAPLVDPTRTAGQVRIGGAEVDEIPLSGRVVTDLALLDSAVRPTPPGNFYGERGSVFVINGQTGRSNSFLVDGLDNNDQTSGTSLNAFFSQQVIQEFVVQTSQFAPEFGRASGGVMNIITRQGGNQFRGQVFGQGTSSRWNSAGSLVQSLPHVGTTTDAVGRYQTGVSAGGPFKKDKAFYFVAYEHQAADDVVPYTGVDRSGDPGGIMITPNSDDNLFLRTDFNLGTSNFLMARFSADDRHTEGLNVGGNVTPESGFHLDESDYQFAVSLKSLPSRDLIHEVRLLVASSSFDQFANSDRPGVDRPSGVFGGNNLNRQLRDEDRLQLVDNMTVRRGDHTLKFGLDITRSRTHIRTRFNPNGNLLYDTDRRFEPGDGFSFENQVDCINASGPDVVPCPGVPGVDDDGDGLVDEPADRTTFPVVFQLIEGQPEARLNDTLYALFGQDSWQVTPRFLLDYGIRWDFSTFRLPRDTAVPSTKPNGGAGRDWNNFAPRLGFTFTPGSNGRTVIRGGAGIFYDKLVLAFPAVAAITSGTRIGLFFPQGFGVELDENLIEQIGIEPLKEILFFPDSFILRFSTGTRMDTPYAVQLNAGFEKAVGQHGAWRLGVTRVQGYHQALMRDLNPVDPAKVVHPSGDPDGPGIPIHEDDSTGSIAAVVTEGRSWYTGLDVGWKWRSEDSWYSISYTLSRSEDLGPDPLKGGIYLPPDSHDLSTERGRSDYDRRHRFVLSGETVLPWLGIRASGVIQLASGAPFNVTTGRDENLDGITTDRPEGVARNGGEDTPLGPVNAIRQEEGLSTVTSLHEPSFAQMDVRLARPFPMDGGKATGEFFVQIFNLFDRFNGGPVEGRVTSARFGEPVGLAGPPRIVEAGFKLGF